MAELKNKRNCIAENYIKGNSAGVAVHNLNPDLVGCEFDESYFNAAVKRLKEHQKILTLDFPVNKQ